MPDHVGGMVGTAWVSGRCVPEFEALVVDDTVRRSRQAPRAAVLPTARVGASCITTIPRSRPRPIWPRACSTLGEIGYVDNDGYVFVTDRFSDMVVSGGVNLYPAEAERCSCSIRTWPTSR